jgi:hypothetical protein
MRQHDDIELVAGARDAMHAADRIFQLCESGELRRRERADGDDELWAQQRQLTIEMRAARGDLVGVGNAIAAGFRVASREAADHGADVHARAERFFVDAEVVAKPGEEALACGVRERPAALHLVRTGRLADQHDARVAHPAGHRLAANVRACAAREERVEILIERHRTEDNARSVPLVPATIAPVRMKRLLALILLLVPTAAGAWTHASDLRIAKKSAALAPPDMRLLIERYAAEYERGLQRAEAEEGTAPHHYFVLSRSGRLRDQIQEETAATIAAVRGNKPMSELVERLGSLAHLVADANNPFHVSNGDPRLALVHDDFEQYFERRMSKFPTVFYGLANDFVLGTYLDKTFSRSARFYPLMSEEYFRNGEEHTSAQFDDRSTAFGIAAVSYSHAVTDLVNLYYYIWREAGGDVRSASVMRSGNLTIQ